MWEFQDEPNPAKVVRNGSIAKQMWPFTVFGKNGHIATNALENDRANNSD